MKVCDVCKRKDGDPLSEESVHTVTFGTSIQTVRVGEPVSCPREVELCYSCLKRVNEAIVVYLDAEFGLNVREYS